MTEVLVLEQSVVDGEASAPQVREGSDPELGADAQASGLEFERPVHIGDQNLPASKRRCVLVVGMHRSGTSSLCGLLAQFGLQRPLRELPPQEENPKGFFEPKVIVERHDELLHALGTSWDSWRRLPKDWLQAENTREFAGRLKQEFILDFPIPGTPFVKDPRICLLFDLWMEVLNSLNFEPLVILVFRKPHEVAQSLFKRNGIDERVGLLIWLRYLLESERSSRGQSRHFVHYDENGVCPFNLSKLLDKYAIDTLPLSDKTSEQYYDPSLRHHNSNACDDAEDISITWYREVFRAFVSLQADPYDVSAMNKLDKIYKDFETALASLAPILILDK